MVLLKHCFMIEGGDKLWVEVNCCEKGVVVCVIGREPLGRSRRLGGVFDKAIKKIVGYRGRPLECKSFSGHGKIVGYKRIDERLYIIFSIGGVRIYIPVNKEKLLRECLRKAGKD